MHTFHDGSVLKVMSAKELVKVPIWKGNRTMDVEHANKIRDAIIKVESLDSGYRIVNYEEADTTGNLVRQSYLIDGQHRAHILREHFLNTICEPDFSVVVTEKNVASESEAIEFFNAINNVKAQRWATDPNILVNNYIAEMEKRFNTKTTKLIRPGATCRPYLSAERLREALKLVVSRLGQEPSKIKAFVQRAVDRNDALLKQTPMLILSNTKDTPFYEKGEKAKFMLAIDPKLKWVSEILS